MSNTAFKKIKAPTYKVDGETLNEYELRQLMLEIAQGKKEPGYIVVDEKGKSVTLKEDGSYDGNELFGMNISDRLAMELLSYINNKDDSEKERISNIAETHLSSMSIGNQLQEFFIRTSNTLKVK